MLGVNDYEEHVAARLLDFFGFKTPWQRGLWTSGVVLTLREVLQASEAVSSGALSNASLANIASNAIILAGKDPGVGDDKQKKALQNALRVDPKRSGLRHLGSDYRVVRQIVGEIEPLYLDRWSKVLPDPSNRPGPERAARAIAAHMLDAGFSEEYLHRWWTYKLHHEEGTKSLATLVAEAYALVSQPLKEYEIVVAFERAPLPASPQSPEWMSNVDVSNWLKGNGFDVAGVRQRGGLRLLRKARDPRSAVELVVEHVERLMSRVKLGSYKQIVPIPNVWIAGERAALPLRTRGRRVEVHALSRQNQIYNTGKFSVVDAAIELVAPLDAGSPSPAIAGGWAALEALLTGPGDEERVAAADRMAALVACSFPRAELTELSYQLELQGGSFADQLKACTTNRERAALVSDAINNGSRFKFSDASDGAALRRITALLKDPSTVLADIEAHASNCFRRLYRHRNLVLHWGKTDAVGLRACLRTVAPLVGAGMDRIAHGWFVEKIEPLELAARARIRLDTIGAASRVSPLNLLE